MLLTDTTPSATSCCSRRCAPSHAVAVTEVGEASTCGAGRSPRCRRSGRRRRAATRSCRRSSVQVGAPRCVEVEGVLQLEHLALAEPADGGGEQPGHLGAERRRDLGGLGQQEVAGEDRLEVAPAGVDAVDVRRWWPRPSRRRGRATQVDQLDRHAAVDDRRRAPVRSAAASRRPAGDGETGRTRLPPAAMRWLAISVRCGVGGHRLERKRSSRRARSASIVGHRRRVRPATPRYRGVGGNGESPREARSGMARRLEQPPMEEPDRAWPADGGRQAGPVAVHSLHSTSTTLWEAAPLFERFTDRARRVVVLAQEEARLLNHNYIGTEHILLGLIHEGEGVAAKALESLGISLEAVRSQVEEIIGQGGSSPSGPHPLHPAGQEGPRAVAARGAAARPQLHRHRAHPPRPHP
jgi:hypothetical protein